VAKVNDKIFDATKQKARTKAGLFYFLGGFGFLGLPQGIITPSY